MARKKAVEPQDGQEQEPNIPAEDALAGEPGPVEDVPEDTAPSDGEGGDVPSDFSGEDENPFMVGGEDAMPPDDTHVEPPGEPAPEDTGEDYAAVLQAVKESGGMEEVALAEPAPLLLSDVEEDGVGDGLPPPDDDAPVSGLNVEEPVPTRVVDRRLSPRPERARVLTIDPRAEVQTQEDLEDIVWHELQNANRTRHPLTGTLDSVERTDNGMTVAIVRYKGFKVMIPLKEMMVHTGPVPSGGVDFNLWVDQVTRILHARQNSDIDFVVRGVDDESRTVVGSRRDAMLRKRKRFYLELDELGNHMIEEGRTVQARVVAVAEKLIRVEVFGVECNVTEHGSSRMWMGNARDQHYVGELILVRVHKIERHQNPEHLRIQVDVRSVYGDAWEKLSQCQPQCRYVGQVTDVRRGVVYVRLNNGANAIAHTCYDMRMPGKKDTVSFSVTRLDEKRGIAIGIITRIIKQNL